MFLSLLHVGLLALLSTPCPWWLLGSFPGSPEALSPDGNLTGAHSLLNLSLDRCFQLPRVPSRSWCCPGRTAEGPSPGLTGSATKHNCLTSGCYHPQTRFPLQRAKLRTLALHPPSCGTWDKSPPLSAAGQHQLHSWQ